MGSTLLLIVCNMYMESFEQKALATADPLLNWWKRCMEDTHSHHSEERTFTGLHRTHQQN